MKKIPEWQYNEFEQSIHELRKKTNDEEFIKDAAMTYREEFPTFDWIMDEMLKRSGFRIDEKHSDSKTWINYICTKDRKFLW